MPPLETILAHPILSRRLYWGLNTLLALVSLLLLWPLAGLLLDQRAEIRSLEIQRAAQAPLAARVPRLLAEQATLVALDGLPADYLSGDSADLAAASLQSLLAQQVQAAGGQVISTRAVPADDPQVAVRLDASVTHAQLRNLLHAVEGGQPRLIVTDMDLQSGQGGESLSLSLTVTGLRREGGGVP